MNKLLKSNLKFIIPVIGLLLLFYSFSLFNYQEKALAQNQSLVCETKIPIGESVDRTSDLLNDMYKELETIYRTIPGQIQAAQEMINGAQECDLDHCKPVCVDTSCYARKKDSICPGDFTCTNGVCPCSECTCEGEDCRRTTGSCTCNCKDKLYGGCCLCSPFCIATCVEKTCKGKICPALELPNILVIDAFEDINNSFEKIKAMYGKDAKESQEIGDDIMLEGETEDDRITREEAIQRKLNRARIEFNNCTIPYSEWEKAISMEIAYTRAISCKDILKQGGRFPLEQLETCRDLCEETNTPTEISIECTQCLCGSLINYFCCH